MRQDSPRGTNSFRVQLLSSTLAISRIPKQIQWFSGSGLEALSPCFATVFFCKWPKSSCEEPVESRTREGSLDRPMARAHLPANDTPFHVVVDDCVSCWSAISRGGFFHAGSPRRGTVHRPDRSGTAGSRAWSRSRRVGRREA